MPLNKVVDANNVVFGNPHQRVDKVGIVGASPTATLF